MEKIILVNKSEAPGVNPSVKMFNAELSTAVVDGPIVSAHADENELNVCLIPRLTLEVEGGHSTTKPVDLDGQFVVEIDGVIVPYYFSAENLSKFFDEENTHGYGIMFDTEIPPQP